MKRIGVIGFGLVFCLLLSAIVFSGLFMDTPSASAESRDIISYDLESLSCELFGNAKIESKEFLYNLDDSPDFVYVKYANSGYAVFATETLELLEYAPMGSLPYQNARGKRYYSGPQNYFTKTSGKFVNAVTNESFFVSEAEAKSYSQSVREVFKVDERKNGIESEERQELVDATASFGSKPPIDESAFIQGTSAFNVTYINNYQYFATNNPTHGENEHNTCGSVAAQLLLSYNNYFNDRRIIANNFLNGSNANNTERKKHPNFCPDPMSMTSQTLGSNNNFYNMAISAIEPGGLNCVDTVDANGDTIHSHSGSSVTQVRNGIRTILNAKNISYTANYYSHNTTNIKAQINAQRPVIILMQKSLGGSNHYVVGYGYGDYTYPDGSGTYSGYIVHFGWEDTDNNVWINSAWCSRYISLQINHTHNYNVNVGGRYMEKRCGDCGHRIHPFLADANGVVTGLRYAVSGNITIPSTINGKPVTGIGNAAFAYAGMTGLTIPASVTSIGANAFQSSALTTIDFASGSALASIGNAAFAYCSNLEGIDIPADVTSIGADTFLSCAALKNVRFLWGSSATSIGNAAFAHTESLTDLEVPSGVKEIGHNAFQSSAIENLYFTSGSTLSTIGNSAFAYTPNLGSINFPASLESIGANAFQSSAISGATFPSGSKLTSIGNAAFIYCENLTGIAIPAGVSAIGTDTFRSTPLASVTFAPNSKLTSIGNAAFYYCEYLTSIVLPTSVKSIGNNAFQGCASLASVSFSGSGGNLISTPDHSTAYSNHWYTETPLDVELVAGATYTLSFNYDSLTASTALTNVFTNLGVGENSFALDLNGTVKGFSGSTSGTQTITFTPSAAQLAASKKLWCRFIRTSTQQSASINIRNVQLVCETSQLQTVGSRAFASSGLTGISLPNTVTSLADRVFQFCGSLTNVVLSQSMTSIGDYAFDTTNISSLSIPASVTSIGEGAFIRCSNLTSITIPNSVTTIGGWAFAECTGLSSVYIPQSATSVGGYAFRSWTSAQTINIAIPSYTVAQQWNNNWNQSCQAVINYV